MAGSSMKVHGTVFSTATMRVTAALYEKGLDFEFVPINTRSGEHKKHPYLSLNPFGQIPAFEDGDLKLFESRAITMHIAHVYADKGNALISHPKDMAIVGVWSEVEAHQYDPIASKLVWELGIKPVVLGMVPDNAVVEENEAKLAKVLDVYESRLSESKYLGGDSFTVVDLHHLPSLTYLMDTNVKRLYESRSHVSAWVKDITARPAWCKVVDMMNN